MVGNELSPDLVKHHSRRDVMIAFEAFAVAFSKNFPGIPFSILSSYLDRQSFGGMNIVIAGDEMPDNWPEMVNDIFDVSESRIGMTPQSSENEEIENCSAKRLIYKIYSFNLGSLQVDLIPVHDQEFEFAVNYLSYGGMGHLMGTVFRQLGVRYGMKGMHVRGLGENGQELPRSDIVLTTDHAAALNFAGYDPARFSMGFRAPEEIFEYIASSPYFNPDIFLNRATEDRKNHQQPAGRENLKSFVAWCEENRGRLPESPVMPLQEARNRIFEQYPWALNACKKKVISMSQRPKAKLNRDLISNVTGIKGPEIAEVAKFAKQEFNSEMEFQEWVLSVSEEELEVWFAQRHKEYLDSKKNS